MKFCLVILQMFFCSYLKSQELPEDSIITRTSLEFSIKALAHDSMKGRFTAMPGTKKAAEFIAQRFKDAGLKPIAGNEGFFYLYPVIFQKDGKQSPAEAINVMGAIQGSEKNDTLLIFCAHYDHIGTTAVTDKKSGDSVYNGANDNASGVALLIELAKYYATFKNNRYTVLFIAFSGEEQGLLGSASMADKMDQSRIHAIINFDMVGRPIDEWTKKCMVIANESKPLIKKLNAEINSRNRFFISDQYPEEGLFTRSDHYAFKNVQNKVFFTASSPRDSYYHTIRDELDTIDLDFLLICTKNIANACKLFLR